MKFNQSSDFRTFFNKNYRSIKVHQKCVEATLYSITTELDNLFRDNSYGFLNNYNSPDGSDNYIQYNDIKNVYEPQKAVQDLLKRNRVNVIAIATSNVNLRTLDYKNLFIDNARIEVSEQFALTNQNDDYENGVYELTSTGLKLVSFTNTEYLSVRAIRGDNATKIFYLNRDVNGVFPTSPNNIFTYTDNLKIQFNQPISNTAKVDVRTKLNQIIALNNSIDLTILTVGSWVFVGDRYFKITNIVNSNIAQYDSNLTPALTSPLINKTIYYNNIVFENNGILNMNFYDKYLILGSKFNDRVIYNPSMAYTVDTVTINDTEQKTTPERIIDKVQLQNISVYEIATNNVWKFYEGEDYLLRYQFKYNFDFKVKLNDSVKLAGGNVIMIGDSGRIYGTTDSNSEVVSIKSNTQQNLNKIFFINDRIGFIVGDNGVILKTINGGGLWERQTSNTSSKLLDVHFNNEDFGMCVGESGECLYTLDGGLNWKTINNSDLFELSTLKFVRTFVNSDGQKSAFIFTSNGMLKVLFESNTSIFVFNETRYPSDFSVNDVYLFNFTPNLDLEIISANPNTVVETAKAKIIEVIEGTLNSNNLGVSPILDGTGEVQSNLMINVDVIDGGSGYTAPVTINLKNNLGTGATFSATLGVNNTIDSINVITEGGGYIETKLNQMILVGDAGKILVIDYKNANNLVFFNTSLNILENTVTNTDYNLLKININDISIDNGLELHVVASDVNNVNNYPIFPIKINPYNSEYLERVFFPVYDFPVVEVNSVNTMLYLSVTETSPLPTYNILNIDKVSLGLYTILDTTFEVPIVTSSSNVDISINDIPRMLIFDYNFARRINLVNEDERIVPKQTVLDNNLITTPSKHDVQEINFKSFYNFLKISSPLMDIPYYDSVLDEYKLIGVDGENPLYTGASLSKEFIGGVGVNYVTVNPNPLNMNEITLAKNTYTNLDTNIIVNEILEFKVRRYNDNIKELGLFKVLSVVDNGSTVTLTMDRMFDLAYSNDMTLNPLSSPEYSFVMIPHNIFERNSDILITINNINNTLSTNYFLKDFYRFKTIGDSVELIALENENSLLFNMSVVVSWIATSNLLFILSYEAKHLYTPAYTLKQHVDLINPALKSNTLGNFTNNVDMAYVTSPDQVLYDGYFAVDGYFLYMRKYIFADLDLVKHTFLKIGVTYDTPFIPKVFVIDYEYLDEYPDLVRLQLSRNLHEVLTEFGYPPFSTNYPTDFYRITNTLTIEEISESLNITDKLYVHNYDEIKFNTSSYATLLKRDLVLGSTFSGVIYTNENYTQEVDIWNIEEDKNISYNIDQLTTIGEDLTYTNFYTQKNDDILKNVVFEEFKYKNGNFTEFDGIEFNNEYFQFIVNNGNEVLIFNSITKFKKLLDLNYLSSFPNVIDLNGFNITSIKSFIDVSSFDEVTLLLTCVNQYDEYVSVILNTYQDSFSVSDAYSYYITVIDKVDTPPVPNVGDRYYVGSNPDINTDFNNHANEIAEWDGSNWIFLNSSKREKLTKVIKVEDSETLGGNRFGEVFYLFDRKLDSTYLTPLKSFRYKSDSLYSNINNISIETPTYISPNITNIYKINNISKSFINNGKFMYVVTGKNNDGYNVTLVSRNTKTNTGSFPFYTMAYDYHLSYNKTTKFDGIKLNSIFENLLSGDVTDIKLVDEPTIPLDGTGVEYIYISNTGRNGGLNIINVKYNLAGNISLYLNSKKEYISALTTNFKSKSINQIVSAKTIDNVVISTQYGYEFINNRYYIDYVKTEAVKKSIEPENYIKGLSPFSEYTKNLIYSITKDKLIKFNNNYRYELPKIERFKVDYKLVDGLTIDTLKAKGYDWILNAVIRNAVIGEDSNGLVWYSGDWICGTWYGGTWHSGQFFNGYWIKGIWNSNRVDGTKILAVNNNKTNSIWYNGEWADGIWNMGTWLNGIFQNGRIVTIDWHRGIHVNGVWMDGHWMGGTWKAGQWYNGIFECLNQYSIWESGTWNGGDFYNGLWINGTFRQLTVKIKSRFGVKSSASILSIWKNGVWKNGDWYSGMITDGVESNNYRYSLWYNGIFENGTWYGGTWFNGVVYNIKWYKGVWKNGTWRNGQWLTGVWEYGQFLNGFFEHGLWKNGYFLGGKWLIKKPEPIKQITVNNN